MSGMEIFEDEETSLFDLVSTLKEGWGYVVTGALLGVLGAVAALLFTPNQYQAMAVVQVGQVGQLVATQAGMTRQVTSVPAEPPAQAAERMKSNAFLFSVAKTLGDQKWMAALQNGGGAGVLSVASPKSASHLIELKAKGDSPEAAKRIVTVAIDELAKRHAELTKPSVDRLSLEADLAREKLLRAESELQKLNKLASSVGVKDERFTQISLMTDLGVKKGAEVFQLRQALSDLDGALTPPNTRRAHAIESVFIADKPVSPKKAMVLALGLAGGLLVGVIAVFVSGAWRRARERCLLTESDKARIS